MDGTGFHALDSSCLRASYSFQEQFANADIVIHRFPSTLPLVVLDYLERLYLAGFPLLQLFVTLFPIITSQTSLPSTGEVANAATCIPQDNFTCPDPEPLPAAPSTAGAASMEFLPLMLTSVYCAVGLTWAFMRLSVLYLRAP